MGLESSLPDFLKLAPGGIAARRRRAAPGARAAGPGGLRREEVAALSGMSTHYYSRLEQRRGTHPSEPMLAAITRGLRLTLDERDHLFRLAGQKRAEAAPCVPTT